MPMDILDMFLNTDWLDLLISRASEFVEEGMEANQLNNQDHNNRVHIHMWGWQDQFCMFLFLNIHSIHMLLTERQMLVRK